MARKGGDRRVDREHSTADLNDDQMAELQALFNLLSGGKPKLDRETLKNNLSKYSIPGRVEDMLKEAGNSDGSIDFLSFSQLMARKMAKSVSEEDMRKAFRTFDWKKSGVVNTGEISDAFTNFGKPPFTARELQEFLAACGSDPNSANYETFLKNMFGKEDA